MISHKNTIVVWFSCGAASAVAAKKTVEQYGHSYRIRVVNNPVIEEHADNLRFLKDVESWLGIPIEIAGNPSFPSNSAVDVWNKRKYMSGNRGAPCTVALKKQARQKWEASNQTDFMVLGFTADEKTRHDRFVLSERQNVLPILIDQGITKADCFKILKEAGIRLPKIYSLGYPNANCIGCVKATSATYWNHVRKVHPAVFEERATQSRDLGAKLVRFKGQRIFLDQLPEDAIGRSLKSIRSVECGIFCEESK